jgi:CBS domain-containing protein
MDVDVKQASNPKRPRMDEVSTTTKYATNPLFIQYLTKLKAEQIPISDGRIFTAQRTDKVIDVWKGLIQHNFLSVPVLQKTKHKYYGFIDVADIVKYMVHHFGTTKVKEFADNFWKLVEQEEFFQTRTVNELMTYPLAKRNPFHPVTKGFSAFCVMELFAKERGLHRVPIINHDRQLVHMVTQSQVIDFLFKNVDYLGDIRNKPIHQFHDLNVDVICVKESDIAMDAFMLMVERNVSGLAVVNDEGKLVGNISLRDLKAISPDARLFWRLYQNVKTFLQKSKENDGAKPEKIVSATRDSTAETVLKDLHEYKIHRIYVVDDHKKPIGVISIKDILSEIISA